MKIKKLIENKKALIFCTVVLIMLTLTILSVINTDKERSYPPSSTHIVMNKWTDKNGRKKQITGSEIKNDTTYKTKLIKIPFLQTRLIFKTENLRFSLYTNGKIIYSNIRKRLGGYGIELHIIDISDIKEGSEIYIHLSPVRNAKGAIFSDILLTSENDYFVNSAMKNIKEIALCFLLIFSASFSGIYGIKKLIKKEKAAPKFIYLSVCLLTVFLIAFLKSDLSFFILNSFIFVYILYHCLYCFLGIFSSCLLCSLFKIKSKAINCFNIGIILYLLLRILLFVFFLLSLSEAEYISYIIIFFSTVLPIIKALPIFRKS